MTTLPTTVTPISVPTRRHQHRNDHNDIENNYNDNNNSNSTVTSSLPSTTTTIAQRSNSNNSMKASTWSKIIQTMSVVVTILMTITAMAFLVSMVVWQHHYDNGSHGITSSRSQFTKATDTGPLNDDSSTSVHRQRLVPVHCPHPNITTRRKSKRTAFLLSLLVGGLGVDRFYLSHIVTGLVKLATAGGLGVWWIVDWMLIVHDVLVDMSGCPLLMDL